MADEKPATPVVDEAAKAEAAYNERLASLIKGDSEDTESPVAPKSEPEEKPKEEEGEPEEEDKEEEKEGEEEPAEEEGGEAAEGEKAPEGKEKYSQAFRKLQRQEAEVQAFKQQVLQRERELVAREQKAQQNEQELVQFVRDLNTDTFETLLRYGLIDEEKANYMARQLYLRSQAAAQDPRSRAEADRLRQQEKLREGQRAVERRLREIEEQREQDRQRQASEYELNQYVARFDATIEGQMAKRPLLAKALQRYPSDTREELFRIASQLAEAKDEYPDPTLVVLAWEKRRKAILAAHGSEQPATTNPAKSKPADEKKGPSNGKSNGSSKAPVTDEEKEAAYQKELRARLNGTWTGAD